MAINFPCKCGRRLTAEKYQMGQRLECPQCRELVTVSGECARNNRGRQAREIAAKAKNTIAKLHSGARELGPSLAALGVRRNTTIQLLVAALVVWALFSFCSLALAVFWSYVVGSVCFFLVSAVLAFIALRVVLAKRFVLRDLNEIDLFLGLVKMISWDPTEGVLLLKNKNVSFVDDRLEDGGGIRLLYPVLGEELALRVPLEIQTLSFIDENVLSREYLPLSVHGTMKWRINDLQKFYLFISREIRVASDRGAPTGRSFSANQPVVSQAPIDVGLSAHEKSRLVTAARKLESAEQWIRYLAEEQTRSIVSRVNTGLLVAERIAAELPSGLQSHFDGHASSGASAPTSTDSYQGGTNDLARSIFEAVVPRMHEFGIEVIEVTLQEIRLPPHIHDAAVEACKSGYIPFIAQKQAAARRMQLQAEADVIGADAVGAREIIQNAPAFALADFLAQFLGNNQSLLSLAASHSKPHVGSAPESNTAKLK